MTFLEANSQTRLLAEKTLSFNLMPCVELDDTWLETPSHSQLYRVVRESSDAEPWLAQYLFDTFDIADRYWCDFSAPNTRLALLDRRTLQKVCLHIGLVLRGPEIRAEVNGTAIKKLRSAVGAEAMDFVFRTAPLIGVPPDFAFDAGVDDIRLDLIALGAAYAIRHEAARESAYITRFLFKLPREVSKILQDYSQTSDIHEKTDALSAITRRVIKEAAPQWLPLFN
ncbi:MAG: SctK family type III secretion system sorting platform protein [Pseudomonadota bacterium]